MINLPTPERYLTFQRALSLLQDRIGATKAEIACWMFFRKIKAYCHVHEFFEPPEFNLAGIALTDWPSAGNDRPPYVNALDNAFFLAADVDVFDPQDRYIAFAALITRWLPHFEMQELGAANFIRTRVHQSRLHDFAPWLGETELSRVQFPSLPNDWERPRPRAEWAMFDLAEVEAIEAADFPAVKAPPTEQHLTSEPAMTEEIKTPRPRKGQQQEDVILTAIRELGHDPKKIPKWTPGASGVKADVRACFAIPGQMFQSQETFDKAWERLRKGGKDAKIQDK